MKIRATKMREFLQDVTSLTEMATYRSLDAMLTPPHDALFILLTVSGK